MRRHSLVLVLKCLRERGPQGFTELLHNTGLSRSTLAQALRRLRRNGEVAYYPVTVVDDGQVTPFVLIPDAGTRQTWSDYRKRRWARLEGRQGESLVLSKLKGSKDLRNGDIVLRGLEEKKEVATDRLLALAYENAVAPKIRRRVYWFPTRFTVSSKLTRQASNSLTDTSRRTGKARQAAS